MYFINPFSVHVIFDPYKVISMRNAVIQLISKNSTFSVHELVLHICISSSKILTIVSLLTRIIPMASHHVTWVCHVESNAFIKRVNFQQIIRSTCLDLDFNFKSQLHKCIIYMVVTRAVSLTNSHHVESWAGFPYLFIETLNLCRKSGHPTQYWHFTVFFLFVCKQTVSNFHVGCHTAFVRCVTKRISGNDVFGNRMAYILKSLRQIESMHINRENIEMYPLCVFVCVYNPNFICCVLTLPR